MARVVRNYLLDVIRVYWAWFARYPVLLVAATPVVLFVWDQGRGLGVPYQFWAEGWLLRLTAGFATGGLYGMIAFTGYLLEADQPIIQHGGAPRPPSWYFWRSLAPAVVFGAIAPALCLGTGKTTLSRGEQIVLAVGAVIGALAVVKLTDWLAKRALFDGLAKAGRTRKVLVAFVEHRRRPPPTLRDLHLIAALFLVTFLGGFLALSLWSIESKWISPAVAICLTLTLVAMLYGWVKFHYENHTFGILASAVIIAAGLGRLGRFPHRFDAMEGYYRANAGITPSPPDRDDLAALQQWSAALSPGEKRKLVVIATSGGGVRAAAWTVRVLTELERELPGFPRHVRLITGASGGMLGAAIYTTDWRQRLSQAGRSAPNPPHQKELFEQTAADSLSPVTRQFVLRDLPLFPVAGITAALGWHDRGWALERAWESNTGGALSATLRSLQKDEEAGLVPSLVFSPMLAEDGRRILISNLPLGFMTQVPLDREPPAPPVPAVEFFHLFPNATALKLATAARMSASFPYVSPPGVLPTNPPRRVVDAGYYDSYGVSVAVRWLEHHAEHLRRLAPDGIVLIELRDSPEGTIRSTPSAKDTRPLLAGLTTPLTAVMAARSAAMGFRNDEAIATIARHLNQDRPGYFARFSFELEEGVALTWSLTKFEKDKIATGLASPDNTRSLERLHTWWR